MAGRLALQLNSVFSQPVGSVWFFQVEMVPCLGSPADFLP